MKIEAKGLMIGDYLRSKDTCRVLRVMQLTGIVGDNIMLEDGDDSDVSTFEPIPLTEEILKANGFIYKDTMEEWWHEEYDPIWGMFMSDFELTAEYKFGRAKISFVHELQHALRLCGLGELADNFKVE